MTSHLSYCMQMREVHALYDAAKYSEALAQLQEVAVRFPDYEPQLTAWQAMLHSLKGDPQTGIALLQTALAKNYWYPPALFENDPDAERLRALPEYAELRAAFQSRMETARAAASPDILIIEPQGVEEPWPLLIALHGNNQNARISCEYWWHAASAGWLAALPQSSRVNGVDYYVWNDNATTASEVKAHATALHAHYPTVPAETILGGFSRGAEAALILALTGEVPAAGFVAVSPGGPLTTSPEACAALLADNPPPEGLRGAIVVGEDDPISYNGALRLAEILGGYGVACWLDSIPGLDHNYPRNFNAHLDHALDFIFG